ncbi:enhanced serine sensitivity protein SseB [Aminipila butyrica]|uniref:Enhanced serine sensitivity protein SseB n=1 Tax=Aminipila butyrica TaxID=433296 RepID=A0A858BVB2_9FIRM|nr:enhanced serine sensitivity protein SseB C-terminal domain-containing protein [Aminipila butyrica]QIB68995.1 enhanced serine sensitivity protein SseB [Aminipila butyrica]
MEERRNQLIDLYKQLMQEKTRACEDQFFKKLVETELWVPGTPEEIDKNKKGFALLLTGEGRKFVPAFLDREANIGRFQREDLVPMTYDKLKYLIIDSTEKISGVVLNPFAENILLDRVVMELVDARTMGMTLKREEFKGKVMLRTPEALPTGLKPALEHFFSEHLQVEAAWLIKAQREGEDEDYWLLLIDFHGEKVQLFPQVAEIVKPYMAPGQRFELVQKSPGFSAEDMKQAQIYELTQSQRLS